QQVPGRTEASADVHATRAARHAQHAAAAGRDGIGLPIQVSDTAGGDDLELVGEDVEARRGAVIDRLDAGDVAVHVEGDRPGGVHFLQVDFPALDHRDPIHEAGGRVRHGAGQ